MRSVGSGRTVDYTAPATAGTGPDYSSREMVSGAGIDVDSRTTLHSECCFCTVSTSECSWTGGGWRTVPGYSHFHMVYILTPTLIDLHLDRNYASHLQRQSWRAVAGWDHCRRLERHRHLGNHCGVELDGYGRSSKAGHFGSLPFSVVEPTARVKVVDNVVKIGLAGRRDLAHVQQLSRGHASMTRLFSFGFRADTGYRASLCQRSPRWRAGGGGRSQRRLRREPQ
jgi:hypothetical protein